MKIVQFLKKSNQNEPPKVAIKDTNVFHKLIALVTSKNIEIMMLGGIEKVGNTYYIEKLYIPPMDSNSGAFVTTNDEAFGPWLHEIPREERLKMRMHLHTHPKMATNPSGVDEGMINDKVENISDFYIRIIVNHKLEFHVDFFDLENNLMYQETSLHIEHHTEYGMYEIVYDKKGLQCSIDNADKEPFKEVEKDLEAKLLEAPTPKVTSRVGPYNKNNDPKRDDHHPYAYGPYGNYGRSAAYDAYRNKGKEHTPYSTAAEIAKQKERVDWKKEEQEFVEEYNISETEIELMMKQQTLEEYISDLQIEIEEEQKIGEEHPVEIVLTVRDFLGHYYNIDQEDPMAKKEFARALSVELILIAYQSPYVLDYTVKEFTDDYYPQIQEAIKWLTNDKDNLKEEQLNGKVGEWIKNAKYIKAPGFLQPYIA